MFEVKRDPITGLYNQYEIIDPEETKPVEIAPVEEKPAQIAPQRPPLIPKKIKR